MGGMEYVVKERGRRVGGRGRVEACNNDDDSEGCMRNVTWSKARFS